MSLLGKMDRLVYATRLDRIVFMKFQPRTLRWTPLFVIAAMAVGYVVMAKSASSPDRHYLVGWLVFYGAYLAAAFLRVFGPRFAASALNPLDERELMVKARAYAMSGAVLAGFAMLGCFYMGSAEALGFWHPHGPLDWINLGFGLQAGGMLLPTLIASWLQPPPAADGED
jgi:hypothetical protein